MPHIYYLPDEQLVEVEEFETVLDASLRHGIPHTHVCGGGARCSTCRIMVLEGLENCSPVTAKEEALSQRLGFPAEIRLACETTIQGDVTVRRLALDNDDVRIIENQFTGKIKPGMMGQEKRLAILFSDIRGFTTFAERFPPYDVVYTLNRYFLCMGQIVDRYHGQINNYIGDGMLVLFGLDQDPDHPSRATENAVRAALAMLERVEQLNPYIESLYHQKLRIGIGIHTGNAVMGEIGALSKRQVTVIGDAVNLASRIESANKSLGTHLLISASSYAEVKDWVTVRSHEGVKIPGKTGDYTLYEVINMLDAPVAADPPQGDRPRVWLVSWVKAFLRFWRQCWQRLQPWLKL